MTEGEKVRLKWEGKGFMDLTGKEEDWLQDDKKEREKKRDETSRSLLFYSLSFEILLFRSALYHVRKTRS